MISSIGWVPRGVADPNPKRYEMSAAEKELLEQQSRMSAALDEKKPSNDDKNVKTSASNAFPKVDPSTLPPELRMDEYSSGEEDEAAQGSALGNLLVGRDAEMIGMQTGKDEMPMEEIDEEDQDDDDVQQKLHQKQPLDDEEEEIKDEHEDSDSDDELDDVPDSREFMPVNVEGLESMKFAGNAGTMGELDFDEEDDDSEIEDTKLTLDDAVLVLAKAEDDFASLEVHVYDQKDGNLFVHHDIPLPAFPLCLAHGDIGSSGQAGNYVAVGSFNPGIEVWNLDVLNALEPMCILGGEDTSAADELMKWNMAQASQGQKQGTRENPKPPGLRPGSHTDAVMSLSWNKVHRQVIASGSADETVKLWDITQAGNGGGSPSTTFRHHRGKVQSLSWHPTEGTMLATGGFDRIVALVDARSNDAKNCKKSKLQGDCEALAWDPHQSHLLTAATEDGTVMCWDIRSFGEPIWSFVAHEYGVSDIAFNQKIPGMMATCSVDKTVALWDTHGASASCPRSCTSKEMNVGKLYTVSFYPSSPFLMGCAGSGNELAIWDMSCETKLHAQFAGRVQGEEGKSTEVAEQETHREDFTAMMSAGDAERIEKPQTQKKKKNKKKGGKQKRKAHRRG